MRILLLNAPHPAIGSRIPREHLPPLGLLAVGGPLLDAGHEVRLFDAEFGPQTTDAILAETGAYAPDAVLLGHSGSTSAHPVIASLSRRLRAALPRAWIIYGGVFPTYHWREILQAEPQVDLIVRGEGEEVAPRLVRALETGGSLRAVPGLAWREDGRPVSTGLAEPVADLDAARVGWELIAPQRYTYWGDQRALLVQFSRGCPHACTYCGQRLFWQRWRRRDPRAFAAELARLHREHGVQVFNLADECPTADRGDWRAFLEAIVATGARITIVASTRADHVVRDRDILHLYRQAGVARFLLGTESCDEETLRLVRKGGATTTDREAIRLLRGHGIIAMATCCVGFREETDASLVRALRSLLAHDPDQVQMLHATPHRWTEYGRQSADRRVVQADPGRWDYKHQVLASRVPPWRMLAWVKLIEVVMQLRPRALFRLLFHPDPAFRAAMRWYYRIGRKVWFHEIAGFIFRERRTAAGPAYAAFDWTARPHAAFPPPLRVSGRRAGARSHRLLVPPCAAGGDPIGVKIDRIYLVQTKTLPRRTRRGIRERGTENTLVSAPLSVSSPLPLPFFLRASVVKSCVFFIILTPMGGYPRPHPTLTLTDAPS